MHGLALGLFQTIAGNTLKELAREADASFETALELLWVDFQFFLHQQHNFLQSASIQTKKYQRRNVAQAAGVESQGPQLLRRHHVACSVDV